VTSQLFSPIQLAGLTLANRIVVSPMCEYSAGDGCASDWHLTHLGMLVNSGAGLVVVEMTDVERIGRITHNCLGLYSDACQQALSRVIGHCRQIGSAKFGIQLAHAGRKGSTTPPWQGGRPLNAEEGAWETIAPSAIPFGADWPTPRAMTEDDITRVREAFKDAAVRAVRIGFDAVELHMAHGYLLHEFVSPISNKRTDQYGGPLEARMRFPLQVAQVVRAAVPEDIPVGARIAGSDWTEGGLTADDAVVFAKALKAAGFNYVDVSSGGITAETRNPTTPGYNVKLATQVRREAGVATRTVGLIIAPEQAEAIIADGHADMVALARAMLDDPHWGWHAAQALGAEVPVPPQYQRAGAKLWPGAKLRAELQKRG
jgi:NADPH2 dehydrogenase